MPIHQTGILFQKMKGKPGTRLLIEALKSFYLMAVVGNKIGGMLCTVKRKDHIASDHYDICTSF